MKAFLRTYGWLIGLIALFVVGISIGNKGWNGVYALPTMDFAFGLFLLISALFSFYPRLTNPALPDVDVPFRKAFGVGLIFAAKGRFISGASYFVELDPTVVYLSGMGSIGLGCLSVAIVDMSLRQRNSDRYPIERTDIMQALGIGLFGVGTIGYSLMMVFDPSFNCLLLPAFLLPGGLLLMLSILLRWNQTTRRNLNR